MGSHLHVQAPRALLHNHASGLCGSFGSLHVTMSQIWYIARSNDNACYDWLHAGTSTYVVLLEQMDGGGIRAVAQCIEDLLRQHCWETHRWQIL